MDSDICHTCRSKECVQKERHYRLKGRSCTSGLFPADIQDQRECLLCTQCAKACPHHNLTLTRRFPWEGVTVHSVLKPAQILFIMIVSGFVVYEILSEWRESKAVLTWLPNAFVRLGDISAPYNGLASALIMFVAYPALMYGGVWLLSRALSRTDSKRIFVAFSLLLVPTMALAHVLKACLKMTSRIPYWQYVFTDPRGIDTAGDITDKSLILDKALLNAIQPSLSVLMVLVLLWALFLSCALVRRSQAFKVLDRRGIVAVVTGALLYWGVFVVTIVLWRW